MKMHTVINFCKQNKESPTLGKVVKCWHLLASMKWISEVGNRDVKIISVSSADATRGSKTIQSDFGVHLYSSIHVHNEIYTYLTYI